MMSTMDASSRRVELLKLEGLGFTQAEIVKQLSEKAGCTERTIYIDFETRATWQPYLQSVTKPEDILFKVMNRYEQIYRQTSLRMLQANNPLVQIAALNTMLKINSMMYETLVLPDLVYRLKTLEKLASKGVFVP